MRIALIGLAMLWLIAIGCSGSEDSLAFQDVSDVVSRLDDLILSDEIRPIYELIGAYDGRKFHVEPGDYTIEMYVYRDLERLTDVAKISETADSQIHIEGNTFFILHTSGSVALERLLSDLRD